MSVSNILPPSTNSYQSDPQGVRYYVRQLGQALQSNNLPAAQQAYTSLSQLPQFQNAQANPTASANGQPSFAQAITQIGSDLQSGDLASAQQAFSSLQQSGVQANTAAPAQTHGKGGHHHHHAAPTSTASTSSTSTADSSDSPEDQALLALENSLTATPTDNGATEESKSNPLLDILT